MPQAVFKGNLSSTGARLRMDFGYWNMELEVLGSVLAAMLLGGVIGLEREIASRAAGLRTHMLVSGSAALIVGLGHLLALDFSDESYREFLRVDPVRLIEAVVAAVGFIGAGSIIKRRAGEEVQGLTTAASLLMAAGIGIAAGLGHFVMAAGASALCLAVLALIGRWEARLTNDKAGSPGGDDRR